MRCFVVAGFLLTRASRRPCLTGRTHATRVGKQVSSMLALCSGTIQGSGIGLLLFVLYINELAAVLSEYKVTVKFFADDLKLENAWQSLAYSPLGAIVSPLVNIYEKKITY